MAKSDIILNDDHVLVKGELKVDSISMVRINQSPDKKAITVNQNGIDMFGTNGSSIVAHFKREGSLYVGGFGSIRATDLSLSGKATIEKIDSSQISLGGSGRGENPQNGKITMLNVRGEVVLTIDASNAAQIIVPGLGDLISIVKQLKLKVDQL
tara:strand:- start:3849 stop:4310 length:462 start_codon:yes stop_codon:yes gene_type:complete